MNMDGWMPKIHGIPKKSPPLSSIILNMIFDFLIFNTKIKQWVIQSVRTKDTIYYTSSDRSRKQGIEVNVLVFK